MPMLLIYSRIDFPIRKDHFIHVVLEQSVIFLLKSPSVNFSVTLE